MAKRATKSAVGPRGGLQASARALRGWKWTGRGHLLSQPVRCRKEAWYLARAQLADDASASRAALNLRFLSDDVVIQHRCMRLHVPAANGDMTELLGWVQSPPEATHLQLSVAAEGLAVPIEEVVLHCVSERDPKSHHTANVPRWNTYAPPFPLERIFLPATLADLAAHCEERTVEIVDKPRSANALGRRIAGAACILDPAWIRAGQWTLADVEKLAARAWVIIDLESMARLLKAAGACDTSIRKFISDQGIMSARNEYADVPTRGLALQDVVPYSLIDSRGMFQTRVLSANRSWKRYADENGLATLLSCETPWDDKNADVLSAALPTSGGELITTDLPWLVAGTYGSLLAPRIAQHLLRMHLGLPLDDHVQYWNRWDEGNVVVRDLGDFARRYAPLRTARWAAGRGHAHLGIACLPDATPRVHTWFDTGRIDTLIAHDGVPPEPMTIFMKWLAREIREQTEWARAYLTDHLITWQFDTHDGLKYATSFDSAADLPPIEPRITKLRLPPLTAAPPEPDAVILPTDGGLHGDGALAFQDDLTQRLKAIIEHNARTG